MESSGRGWERWQVYSHVSDDDRFRVVWDITLGPSRERWEDAQGLVAAELLVSNPDLCAFSALT